MYLETGLSSPLPSLAECTSPHLSDTPSVQQPPAVCVAKEGANVPDISSFYGYYQHIESSKYRKPQRTKFCSWAKIYLLASCLDFHLFLLLLLLLFELENNVLTSTASLALKCQPLQASASVRNVSHLGIHFFIGIQKHTHSCDLYGFL